MTERRLILSPKSGHRPIGYVEGDGAFDLSGRRHSRYNADTGNLHDLETGRIVGHVSLEGRFAGSSWEAKRLFGEPDVSLIASSPSEETAPSTDLQARMIEPLTSERVVPADNAPSTEVMRTATSESDASFERALAILRGVSGSQ
jgi:hypothetical protein